MRVDATMNPTIFREYDIRGVANEDYDARFAYLLGRALGTRVRGLPTPANRSRPGMAVGRDCRLTSDEFAEALGKGLADSGVDVIDVGMCPTPLLYFSLFHFDVDGGVQITGSHNPPEYNGFKICLGKSSIYGEAIASLRGEIEKGDFASGKGAVRSELVIPAYRRLFIVRPMAVSRTIILTQPCRKTSRT
jgi:phosphomannomutase / phosphoglucomutase